MNEPVSAENWSSELHGAAMALRASHPQLAYWVALAADELPRMASELQKAQQLIVRQANELRKR